MLKELESVMVTQVLQVKMLRVKICGITSPEQGIAIAALGAQSIGFICVKKSPRYVTPEQIRAIASVLPNEVDRVGVFMNTSVASIVEIVKKSGLTSVQLHGDESVEFCSELRSVLREQMRDSSIELIKAFRIESAVGLVKTHPYSAVVDWLLLDAYHPTMGGGTGLTLDWSTLGDFKPTVPWLLAGGLNADNVREALQTIGPMNGRTIGPQGIDLSSGVERSPGDKDLGKVARLFENLKN